MSYCNEDRNGTLALYTIKFYITALWNRSFDGNEFLVKSLILFSSYLVEKYTTLTKKPKQTLQLIQYITC